jgi:hypothetical protein
MRFTLHAKVRFAERFPDCPLSLEQAYYQAVPFGATTKSTIHKIHLDYKIVFVIDKSTHEQFVKTVLTEALYYGNTQMLGGFRTVVVAPEEKHITVSYPELTPAEEYKEKLKQKEIEEKEIASILKEQAKEFAKLKHYVPWHKGMWKEARDKYNCSKKMIVDYFLPAYLTECNLHQMFNS